MFIKRKSLVAWIQLRWKLWNNPNAILLDSIVDYGKLYEAVMQKENQLRLFHIVVDEFIIRRLNHRSWRDAFGETRTKWNSLNDKYVYAIMAGAEVESFLDDIMVELYNGTFR